MKSADVVIIGGGVIGCSIAYHLAAKRAGRIVLLEREAFLGTGSTAKAAGGFRHQFSNEANIRLSIKSISKLESFADEIGWTIDFHQDGYLFLLSREEDVAAFRRSVELQRRLGVPVEMLVPEDAAKLVPGLFAGDVLAATFCSKDGIAEAHGVTQGYAQAARRLGAEIITCMEATGINVKNHKVTGVVASDGPISTPVVINAAGPWARSVAAMAGIDLPVYPYRRMAFTTHPFDAAPRSWTMTVDFSTSFYFHRESGGVLMGMSDESEPSSFNQAVDWNFLDKVIEVAVRRFPPLAEAGISRAWAGLYEVTPDSNPIICQAPEVEGFYLANGFSGHGFMHAPAVGELLAELIVDGRTSIDLSPFSLERFSRAELEAELNVI